MKPAITQLCLSGMDLDQALRHTKESGYEGIELRFFSEGEPSVNASDAQIREVGEMARKLGLDIPSIISWTSDRGNLLSPNKDDRTKLEGCISRALQIAEILKVDGILLHPGALSQDAGTYDDAWVWAKESLQRTSKEAEKRKVCICVENVWNKFLLNGREMRLFLDEVKSDYVGCYLDTGNMIAYGFCEQWIRELGKRVKKVHVKDFKRKDHKFVDLTDGDVNWPAAMAALRKIGFDGCLTQEVGGPPAAHAETAKRIRKIMAM